MKIKSPLFYRLFCGFSASIFVLTLLFGVFFSMHPTYAESKDSDNGVVSDAHFVTFHDDTKSLTIKTTAKTVAEALERAKIQYHTSDHVEPALTESINSDNFHINIYRARPVIIKNGSISKFIMTASVDPKEIAQAAGITIYDGDELSLVSLLPSKKIFRLMINLSAIRLYQLARPICVKLVNSVASLPSTRLTL